MQEPTVHYVSFNTIIALVIFLIVYEYVLLKRVSLSKLGLFDFCILSTVAVLPAFFVFFPPLILWITQVLGVGFPFVLMFSGLFFVIFVFMFRVVHRLYKIEKRIIQFAQEEAIKHEQVLKESHAKSRG